MIWSGGRMITPSAIDAITEMAAGAGSIEFPAAPQ
jgi:hypothetical protein